MKGKTLERVLKALANKRRLAIVRYLKNSKEASVSDIAAEIKLSFNATSKHLGVLYGADVLDREQRSSRMFYRPASDLLSPVRSVISLL